MSQFPCQRPATIMPISEPQWIRGGDVRIGVAIETNEMIFARRTFLIAGIYGLLGLLPLYFMEGRIGREQPPPSTIPNASTA